MPPHHTRPRVRPLRSFRVHETRALFFAHMSLNDCRERGVGLQAARRNSYRRAGLVDDLIALTYYQVGEGWTKKHRGMSTRNCSGPRLRPSLRKSDNPPVGVCRPRKTRVCDQPWHNYLGAATMRRTVPTPHPAALATAIMPLP
jgi:hypothetical protein